MKKKSLTLLSYFYTFFADLYPQTKTEVGGGNTIFRELKCGKE